MSHCHKYFKTCIKYFSNEIIGFCSVTIIIFSINNHFCDTAHASGRSTNLNTITYSQLIVTSGEIEKRDDDTMTLRSPIVRATIGNTSRNIIEIDFRYLGPTLRQVPLASGEYRRQIGLKMRERNTCNVIYAMWHIEPTKGIHVSVKSNPKKNTHSECQDGGYKNLTPYFFSPTVPEIRYGESHRFGIRIDHNSIHIDVDGLGVWSGELPRETLGFEGPAGIRSDNGIFNLRIRASESEPIPPPLKLKPI